MVLKQFEVVPGNGVQNLYVYAPVDAAPSQQFMVYPLTQGSGGNRLLTTSYIVDMGYPRPPTPDMKPRSDSPAIKWDFRRGKPRS